jgi:hypothetical protein
MAISAPARRSGLQTAPSKAPPPEPKKRPRDRPRPGGPGRSSAAAPEALRKQPKGKTAAPARKSAGTAGAARKAGARAATAAPVRKAAPGKKASSTRAAATATPKRKVASRASAATAAPARKAAPRGKAATDRAASPARKPSRDGLVTAPSRHKAQPRRRPSARVIPLAAGRAAAAVTQLPESGLIHRLTRGRAWIGLLGVLLVGIVALNVVTLSFAASSGKVEERNSILEKENTVMQGKAAAALGAQRMRNEAKELKLVQPAETQPQMITARPTDIAEAASRLAAQAAATSASASSGSE